MKEYEKPMVEVLNFEDNKILTYPEMGSESTDEEGSYQ